MPKAYAVVTSRSVSNPEKLAAYAKLAGPAVAPFGARTRSAHSTRQGPAPACVRSLGLAQRMAIGFIQALDFGAVEALVPHLQPCAEGFGCA